METGQNPQAAPKAESNRIDWERNHEAVKKCFIDHLNEHGTTPSIAQVVEATGFADSTVKAHIKSLKSDTSRFEKYLVTTELVIEGMLRGARAGDARCGKLYLQFVEGWVENKKVTQVNQNPYAGLSEEDIRKKAAERRAAVEARRKAMDAARDI